MTVKAGIVCGKCDTLNPVENRRCAACSSNLQLRHTLTTPIEQNKMNKSDELQKVAADGKEDESMEQARHMVCTDCYTPVPAGHKFCGKCGKSLEDNIVTEPEYFSKLQTKGKAKLILIKGDGEDGRAYHLNSKKSLCRPF
jgi:ribosomal protein L40E